MPPPLDPHAARAHSYNAASSKDVLIAHTPVVIGNTTLPPWIGVRAPSIPTGKVTEYSVAASEAHKVFGIDASHDKMRVIYIKVFKVGSTTSASIFHKLSLTRGLVPSPILVDNTNADEKSADVLMTPKRLKLADYIAKHNNFRNGQTSDDHKIHVTGAESGQRQVDSPGSKVSSHEWQAGYQPWMDYYMPKAWRVVTVSEPAQRVVSTYYWKSKYTKSTSHHIEADDTTQNSSLVRFNENPQLATPLDPKEVQRQYDLIIGQSRCRPQWPWLREGTPNHTFNETLQMLRSGAFLVGITHYMDESLILFRHFMGLFIEDILYFNLNAVLSHPHLEDWHPDNQAHVHKMVNDNGDAEYYRVAMEVFEHQVAFYGGWDKLREETDAFKAVNGIVNEACKHVAFKDGARIVQSKTVCLVAEYRKLGLANRFREL